MQYRIEKVDERYDLIVALGKWQWSDGIEMNGSEPFDMETAMYYRWDKDSRGWVAGLIKKNGKWVRGNSIEGQLLGKWRKLKSRLGIENQE